MPTAPTPCPKCSTPIPEGGRFCTTCGFDISDPAGGTTLALTDRRADELQRAVAEATRGVYRIERELGRGGMAAVYLATELELHRKVAIKILPPEFTFGEGLVERFQREARTAAQLDHPNIIPIYRVGSAGRLLYFAMKFVEGRSLADILRERKALPIPTVTAVLEVVGSALAYAHSRGVVHRDIKPANILIDRQGVALVSDFGIARAAADDTITQSGAVVGTPQYMSPEQCAGRRVTAASDQYSLGVVGFEMLAGQPPFDAESAITLLQKHITEPPPRLTVLRPDAQPELVKVIERAMRKQPEQRFLNMTQFTEAIEMIRIAGQHAPEGRAQLKALAVGDTLSGLRVVTPISGASKLRRRRPTVVVGTAVAVAVLGAGGIGLWAWIGSSPEGSRASVVRPAADTAVRRAQRVPPTRQDSTQPGPTVGTAAPATLLPAGRRDSGQQRANPPQQTTSVPLRPATATLRFSGVPGGAAISVDGTPISGTRATLAPGSHDVQIRAPGYQPFSQTVSLVAGDTRALTPTLQPIPQQPGRLTVGSLPVGILFIDGQRIGELPVREREVPAGPHRIRIEASGHVPFDTAVTIPAGESVNLRLIRLRPTGSQ